MKTAREMFEEAGYNCENREELDYISYTKEDELGYISKTISFDLDKKTFCCNEDYELMSIDMETLKLIIIQCKELRWLF